MATEDAIRACIHVLDRKGLLSHRKGAHRDFDSHDERVRARIFSDTIIDWFDTFADVDDDALRQAFTGWRRSDEASWYPDPGKVRKFLPARLKGDIVERAADAAWSELWRQHTLHRCGPDEPRNKSLWVDYLEDLQREEAKLAEIGAMSDEDLYGWVLLKARKAMSWSKGAVHERYKARWASLQETSPEQVRVLVTADLQERIAAARQTAAFHGPRWEWSGDAAEVEAKAHTLAEMGGLKLLLLNRRDDNEPAMLGKWRRIFTAYVRRNRIEGELAIVQSLTAHHKTIEQRPAAPRQRPAAPRQRRATAAAQPTPQLAEHLGDPAPTTEAAVIPMARPTTHR